MIHDYAVNEKPRQQNEIKKINKLCYISID